MSLSPAERYALSRQQRRQPRLAEFAAELRFDLDPFQRASCAALDEGRSVLVAAPTGAGKTVVAEFAVFLAMSEPDAKVFYTTLDPAHVEDAAAGLKRAAGFLRSQLARRIKLYTTPELRFAYDESVERGDRLSRLIDSATKKNG